MIFEIDLIQTKITLYKSLPLGRQKSNTKAEIRYMVSTIPRHQIPEIAKKLNISEEELLTFF